MKEKDYRAIRRYNALKAVYPGYIPDDVLFPLIFDAKAPEFDKAVTSYKRKWASENGFVRRVQRKRM